MAQRLTALVVLTQAISLILSNHMVAQNYMEWGLVPSSGLQEYMQGEHSVSNEFHICLLFFKALIPYLYNVLPACIFAGQKRAQDPIPYSYEPPCGC